MTYAAAKAAFRIFLHLTNYRYTIIAAEAAKAQSDPKKAGEAILAEMEKTGVLLKEEFQVGLTKVCVTNRQSKTQKKFQLVH